MLRVGRIKESVYKRSVIKQLHNDKKRTPFDAARTIVVDGWTLAADRIVTNMINTFVADRSYPSTISVSLVMPEGTEEEDFRRFIVRFGSLCAGSDIRASVSDVRVLSEVKTPVFTAVGITYDHHPEPMGKLAAGLDVVAAGAIACEGTAVLALEKEKQLKERFAGFFVDAAKELFYAGAMPAIRVIMSSQDAAGIAVREGGIFGGLWELGTIGKVGLDIDLRSIPVRQHTIEICEYFNINPYMLLSGGCMLLTAPGGEALVSALSQEGIPAAVIGRTCSGNDRIVRYDDEIRYLEPAGTDEIYRIKSFLPDLSEQISE